MDFDLVTRPVGDHIFVIALSGEVDLYTAPELKAELLRLIDRDPERIVVDLSGATFVDSTTLGVLLGAVRRLRPAGGDLVIACSDLNVRKVLSITMLDRAFRVYDTPGEALAAPAVPPAA